MAESNITEQHCTGVITEVYKIDWKIKNWTLVQYDRQLIEKQIVNIQTGMDKLSDVKSTWNIGFKMSTENQDEVIRIYWQLIKLEGGIQDIAVKTSTTFMYGNGLEHSTHVTHATFQHLEQIEVPKFMSYNLDDKAWIPGIKGSWVDANGCRNFKLELIVKLPCADKPSKVFCKKLENFRHLSTKKYQANWAALLDDPASADIKIVTSDDKQLFAHRLILKAQCPVFDTMFRSKLTEDKTGIVNVDDICEKTMKIILHYFYTGQLLPDWKDKDVIVEFIYAAGKYQMIDILGMINNGLLEEEQDFDLGKMGCEMEVLSILHKLSLTNAESWLMKKIIKATNQVKSSVELLALLGNEK